LYFIEKKKDKAKEKKMRCFFDDERETNKAGRRLENDVDYQEYKILYGNLARLQPYAIWRNYPYELPNKTRIIPRIQKQIDAETSETPKKQDLQDFQTTHIKIWQSVDDIIDEICENHYVLRRLPSSVRKVDANGVVSYVSNPTEVKQVRDYMYSLFAN
jgi:hypothetical protein